MVGVIVISLTDDAVRQEAVVGSEQRVVVVSARAPRDVAVQHCLKDLGSEQPEFKLEESPRSVIQLEGVLPEAGSCVAFAPIDLDIQVGIVVDIRPEIPTRSFGLHLARFLYAECGGELRHTLRA